MRTTSRTSSSTRTTRRGPVVALAAVALAVPISGLFGGIAFAGDSDSSARGAQTAALKADATHGNSDAAKAAKDDRVAAGKPADFIGPVAPTTDAKPFENQGGVTTGSNTTKYETVQDQKGATFTGVGGGQPSGDIKSPQPLSTADQNNTGANDQTSNPYASTRNGDPSLNGNGGGQQVGQPCAGCVGKADNKNPPGQAPNATDGNAGYECDRNHGIGRSNPAHTGCTGGTPGTTTGGTTGTTGGTTTGGTTGTTTGGGHQDNGDVAICHATGSASNPYVLISPSKAGVVNGHLGHSDDIIPAFSWNGTTYPAHGDVTLLATGCTTGNGGGSTTGGGNSTGGGNGTTTGGTTVTCPTGATMVSGVCTVPAVCPAGPATMVNGVCTVPSTCPAGTTEMANGTCALPISDTNGGGAVGTGVTPTVISEGTTPQAVELPAVNHVTTPAAGGTAAPGALPFTGSNTATLLQIAALMLLVGGGLALATRNPRPARAVV